MNKPADFQVSRRERDEEESSNASGNASFMDVLEAGLRRRGFLKGGVGAAASMLLGGLAQAGCGGGGDDDDVAAPAAITTLSFTAVAKSTADTVTVPAGYTATPIYALGDPLTAATAAFANNGTDTDYDNRAGDHHDGMEYFGLNADSGARDASGSTRGLLAINHEALTDHFLHVAGSSARPRPAAESDKEIPAHGVSIVEVRKTGTTWAYVQASSHNRRVTPLTPVELSGVARGNALMKTLYSPAGTGARGTINNCGTGYTPWGTFLTGEENFEGYFTRGAADDAARGNDKSVVSLNRYKRRQGAASRHGWETSGAADKYARWNIGKLGASTDGSDDYRNELNTFGFIVEIDPYDKTAAIKKRTTLGRCAHESAAFGKVAAGKPLAVYMGDDSRGEYIYKYVSNANWDAADAGATNRIAVGDKYLDAGKLYVAKFNADGTGAWLLLNRAAIPAAYTAYAFADEADVAVNARLAADAVGATPMDRPEWCAVHPTTGEIYYTLTNNSNRRLQPATPSATTAPDAIQRLVDPANPRSYNDAPSATGSPGNVNGHIIRMREAGDEPSATTFTWDVYLFGSQSARDATSTMTDAEYVAKVNLSGLTGEQDFSSPDGLWFSRSTNLCWIQTDDGAYTDTTNCMMLLGVPGKVGDGAKTTLSYTVGASMLNIDTYVGARPTPGSLKRFLVGPKDCELTGCTETPDGTTVFANIQHPGETISAANAANPAAYLSHWPGNAGYGAGGANARPRSATLAITKNDGGRVGS
ncbi:MAG: PhoX family phosphatase [Burkholderiales bacterium]|nr:PhoX family phosphatase [Burkholderiales bacterium]